MGTRHPNAAAAIVALYERLAGRYIEDRPRVDWDEQGSLEQFLAHLPPQRRVLDLGCGAGAPIGERLLNRGCTVTGVDSSPTLIAHCRERLPAGEWLVADMRQLALGREFDGLMAWDSFFHLAHDDQRSMFRVFREHAGPGAALMFTSGHSHGVAMGMYHGEPLYHASLDALEYEALLTANGFTVVAHVVEDPTCGKHTVWLARRIN